jgi:hypothetical protein
MPLMDQQVFLNSGKEQHWYIDLSPGKYRLQAVGTKRFYCGLFDGATYARAKQRSAFRFPFAFASDRVTFDLTITIHQQGLYYVVVRVGTFNPPGANVHVILDRVWY